MSVIKQGAEPVGFKSYFVAWEPQMWNKKMSYEEQMKQVKQENEKVDNNAWHLVSTVKSGEDRSRKPQRKWLRDHLICWLSCKLFREELRYELLCRSSRKVLEDSFITWA